LVRPAGGSGIRCLPASVDGDETFSPNFLQRVDPALPLANLDHTDERTHPSRPAPVPKIALLQGFLSPPQRRTFVVRRSQNE